MKLLHHLLVRRCFYLITCKALMQCSKDICTTAGSHCSPQGRGIKHLPSVPKKSSSNPKGRQRRRKRNEKSSRFLSCYAFGVTTLRRKGMCSNFIPESICIQQQGQGHTADPQFRFYQPLAWCITSETWQQESHPRTNWGTSTSDMEGQSEEMFTLHFPPSICLVRHAEGWVSAAHQ